MIYIPENRIRELLQWEQVYEAVKEAMKSVGENRSNQTGRSVIKLGDTPNLFFTMPGYLNNNKFGCLGCKIFTSFPGNPIRKDPLPSVIANIFLFDDKTGTLKAIISGTEITNWRTAAASVVATKYLHGEDSGKENKILAIIGAGNLGKTHAMAFEHFFNFEQVKIWNRTPDRARALVDELQSRNASRKVFVVCESVQECVRDADVVITATTSSQTLVKFDWLKKGAHINAIGVNPAVHELDELTYKGSNVYIDYWTGARDELQNIESLGVEFKGQIGDVIVGTVPVPNTETTTVFQSLGMAVEDCAVARLVYDIYSANPN